jgi:hypothetical protein
MGFAADKVAMGQVFSEHFGFPCQLCHQLLHTLYRPSSRVGKMGQIVVDVPSGLSLKSPNGKTTRKTLARID